MNLRKVSAIALSTAIAASLCGCTAENESSNINTSSYQSVTDPEIGDQGSSDETTDSSPGSSDDSSQAKEPLEFYGILNEPIARSEIVGAYRIVYNEKTQKQEKKDVPLDQLDESEYIDAYTDFAYYALPLHPCLTDLESEYDETNNMFKEIPSEKKNDFLRIKKGEKLFDMTVTEAHSTFNIGKDRGKTTVYETGLSLKGELTLTGYARVAGDDEYGHNNGEIMFFPIGEIPLPVVNFRYDPELGVIRYVGSVSTVGDIIYTGEFHYFNLGNINDITADISCLSRDGSYKKVSVTISEIEMSSNFDWFTNCDAVIDSITEAK